MLESLAPLRERLSSALEPLDLIADSWLASESHTTYLQLSFRFELGDPDEVFNRDGVCVVQIQSSGGERVLTPTIVALLTSARGPGLASIFVEFMNAVIQIAKTTAMARTSADSNELGGMAMLGAPQLKEIKAMLNTFWPGVSPISLSGWDPAGDFTVKWGEPLLAWLREPDTRKNFDQYVEGALRWRPNQLPAWSLPKLPSDLPQDEGTKIKEANPGSSDASVPTVFISYSWDTPEHEDWVLMFAKRLTVANFRVKLDKWDVQFGDHIPSYMGRSVKESDFVLVVCTNRYVTKANARIGGAGYEANIFTALIMHDQDLTHFIPIVCNPNDKAELPDALLGRYFVDFRNEEVFEVNLASLVTTLNRKFSGTRLGQGSTHSETPAPSAPAPAASAATAESKTNGVDEPLAIRAKVTIAEKDKLSWNRLVSAAARSRDEGLDAWKEEYVRKPPNPTAPVEESVVGIETFRDLICLSLVGLASSNESFVNQQALVDAILHPASWPTGGFTSRINLPRGALFVTQAVHGALALLLGKPQLAFKFANTSVAAFPAGADGPLWRQDDLIAWPASFAGDSETAWHALPVTYRRLNLEDFFGSEEDFLAGLVAYYCLLNVMEFASRSNKGDVDGFGERRERIYIPLHFARCSEHIARRARVILLEDTVCLRHVLKSLGLTDALVGRYWQTWLDLCRNLSREERYFAFKDLPHAHIFNDLGRLEY